MSIGKPKLAITKVEGGKPKIYDKTSSFYAICNGNGAEDRAKLFAAAPELLNALNGLFTIFDNIPRRYWLFEPNYEYAVKIIDKAEGK